MLTANNKVSACGDYINLNTKHEQEFSHRGVARQGENH